MEANMKYEYITRDCHEMGVFSLCGCEPGRYLEIQENGRRVILAVYPEKSRLPARFFLTCEFEDGSQKTFDVIPSNQSKTCFSTEYKKKKFKMLEMAKE